jgi:hypothetical protein
MVLARFNPASLAKPFISNKWAMDLSKALPVPFPTFGMPPSTATQPGRGIGNDGYLAKPN